MHIFSFDMREDKTRVFNADCLPAMKEYPDNYFDLAIVDPPFGIGAGKEKPHNGWADHGIKEWDNEQPSPDYFTELFRVSKNTIIWGANHFGNMPPSPCWIVWDKGQREFSLADAELAWASFNTSVRVFDYSRGRANQENKIHSCQKPVALYKWLLKNYAKEGDKILDTHLGSQSSRIAAFDMGFDFTGYELDKDYFEAGNKRFEQHKSQLKLFPV
jgi:site-specific DNA-methyltransferase (adenine-specific)